MLQNPRNLGYPSLTAILSHTPIRERDHLVRRCRVIRAFECKLPYKFERVELIDSYGYAARIILDQNVWSLKKKEDENGEIEVKYPNGRSGVVAMSASEFVRHFVDAYIGRPHTVIRHLYLDDFFPLRLLQTTPLRIDSLKMSLKFRRPTDEFLRLLSKHHFQSIELINMDAWSDTIFQLRSIDWLAEVCVDRLQVRTGSLMERPNRLLDVTASRIEIVEFLPMQVTFPRIRITDRDAQQHMARFIGFVRKMRGAAADLKVGSFYAMKIAGTVVDQFIGCPVLRRAMLVEMGGRRSKREEHCFSVNVSDVAKLFVSICVDSVNQTFLTVQLVPRKRTVKKFVTNTLAACLPVRRFDNGEADFRYFVDM